MKLNTFLAAAVILTVTAGTGFAAANGSIKGSINGINTKQFVKNLKYPPISALKQHVVRGSIDAGHKPR